MSVQADLEQTLRRYALDDLADNARLDIEERLVRDASVCDLLDLVEDDLVEDYVDGSLAGGDRRRFEAQLAHDPERVQKVQFLRALKSRAVSTAGSVGARGWSRPWVTPAWAAAMAASLLLALAGSGWQAWRASGLRHDLDRVTATTAAAETRARDLEAERDQLARRLDEARHAPPPPTTASNERGASTRSPVFALGAGIVRGEGTLPRIRIPAAAQFVALDLALPLVPAGQVRVMLADDDGRGLFTAGPLRAAVSAGRARLLTSIPADVLPAGDYVVQVHEIGSREGPPVASFPFRVTR
jgi:hypothetical protein